jgi:hypothetical protein
MEAYVYRTNPDGTKKALPLERKDMAKMIRDEMIAKYGKPKDKPHGR